MNVQATSQTLIITDRAFDECIYLLHFSEKTRELY